MQRSDGGGVFDALDRMNGQTLCGYGSVTACQDWLGRATNWAKFSATAGLCVIHRGHLQQGRSLMALYLPQSGAGGGGSLYSEGGALYALGLIHANHGEGIKQFLRDSLRSTNVIQHGACLGLGLAALELLLKISMTT
ncbi:hypothetical protein ACSBR1_027187 [Camellia fascicularis]